VTDLADETDAAITRLVGELASGEDRPGQRVMAAAVANALDTEQHLFVQAGTGTGKSAAYLIPAVLSGERVVVSTYAKALQDQLLTQDIPLLARVLERPVEAVVVKGYGNYVCRLRLNDAERTLEGQLIVSDRGSLRAVTAWVDETETGDRADLPETVSDDLWREISTDANECVGATRCPHADTCFALEARRNAEKADVIIVNHHLYCLDRRTFGRLLPEHAVVVIDEAHQLAAAATSVFGPVIGRGRFSQLALRFRRIFTDDPNEKGTVGPADRIEAAGAALERAIGDRVDQRVRTDRGELAEALVVAAEAINDAADRLAALASRGGDVDARDTVVESAHSLANDLWEAAAARETEVAWVEPGPRLRVAPLHVGPRLAPTLFEARTVVFTSATLAVGGTFDGVADSLGAPPGTWRGIDVGSPFDYETQALLYCAAHLPAPNDPAFEGAARTELMELIRAAGGRTLALFTSRRALDAAVALARAELDVTVLAQGDLPPRRLTEAFGADETSCLFATRGFFQGIDVPGRALSLVVIDRIPFSRPDDPLSRARQEAVGRAGGDGFAAVALPDAAVHLAQAVGRLVRHREDRGAVAVLDCRLALAKYSGLLVRTLPPMKRTREPEVVRAYLRDIAAAE
jgi:ATP-dependent DNA helicase DinG